MSYPCPVRTAPVWRPQRSYVLGPDEGEAYHWLGSLTLRKVRTVDTRGGPNLVDQQVPVTPPKPLSSSPL